MSYNIGLCNRKGENMKLKQYPDILTVKDVASILKIGTNSAYKLIKNGDIPSHRIGRIYRVPKLCLIKYLQAANKDANSENDFERSKQ